MPQTNDWHRRRLADLTLRSSTWNPSIDPRESVRYVDVSGVSRDELLIVAEATHRGTEAPSRARKIVKSGDTIFATVRPSLRRIAQVPSSLDGELVSTAFCVLRPDPKQIIPGFLFFATQLDTFVSSVTALETGASYPAVRDSDVLAQDVPVPPLAEQLEITAVLELTRSLLLRERECELLARELKRAAMQVLFTGGLKGEAPKETEFGAVPATWDITPLEKCATIQTGAAKGRKLLETETVEVPYLRVANVQDGRLDLTEMKEIRIRKSEIERYRLLTGDVVLTEGGDFDKLGRGFIWRGELDLCVHQNHVFAVRPDRERLAPEFFAYLAQSDYGKAYFLKVAHKTTNLACINSTKLKAFPVLIPSMDEQRAIVEILEALDRKIGVHREKRAVLDDLFKVLLHKLMTGELRVGDLDRSALAPGQAAQVTA